MATLVLLRGLVGPQVTVTGTGSEYNAIHLELQGHKAALKLAKPISIDDRLLKPLPGGSADTFEFLSAAEIQQVVNAEVQRELQAQREKLREALQEAHAVEIDAVGNAEFFGVKAVGQSRMEVSLTFLPAVLDAPAASAAVILVARARAKVTMDASWDAGGASAKAEGALDISVRVGLMVPEAEFALQIPQWPGLDLKLPSLQLPALRFDGLPPFDFPHTFPSLSAFAAIPFLRELAFEWKNPPPKFQVSVSGGALSLRTAPPGAGTLRSGGQDILEVSDFSLDGGDSLEYKATLTPVQQSVTVQIPEVPAGPFRLAPGPATITLKKVTVGAGEPLRVEVGVELPQVLISASNDPGLTLPLEVELLVHADSTGVHTELRKLNLRAPYGVDLLKNLVAHAGDVLKLLGGTIRLLAAIELPKPGAPDMSGITAALRRIGELLQAALRWLAEEAAAAGRLLAGVENAVSDVLQHLFQQLAQLKAGPPGLFSHMAIEVRLDPRTWQLHQVVLMPAGDDLNLQRKAAVSVAGLDFAYDLQARPSLVIDLREPWFGIVLQSFTGELAALGTDLWLSKETAPDEPLSVLDPSTGSAAAKELEQPPTGAMAKPKRLFGVAVDAKPGAPQLVLVAVRRGRVALFQQFQVAPRRPPVKLPRSNATVALVSEPSPLGNMALDAFFDVKPHADLSALEGYLLNLFPKPDPAKQSEPSFLDKLGQYVKVTKTEEPTIKDGELQCAFGVAIVISKDFVPEAKLSINVNLHTLSARLTGGDRISIMKPLPGTDEPLRLLGFDVAFRPNAKTVEDKPKAYEALVLDLRGGRQAFGLGKEAEATITYGEVSTIGRGMVFLVKRLTVASDGLDLNAEITPEPVILGGVDVPFRFTSGGINIQKSRLLGGSLAGSGQLPRALIGEANASIALSLAPDASGNVVLESAEARLDKTGDPIVCEGTRFRLAITELGMGFVRENAYHFYFQLTGSARFTPNRGEATEGLLKHLGALEIQLKKAPLTSDPRVLMRAISFQVKCDPPKTGSFFDIFSFELRGFGFHPSSQAFGGDSAISVSGQVKFAFGDVISSRIDCHELFIAAPKSPSAFPRVRFDGLTVGLQLNGMASVEGTAIAVDEQLPDLFKPGTLPANVTANGFLAAGRIQLEGWAPMSASMGFLELRKKTGGAPRHAFFFYGQRNKLSVEIPTPIGTLYLREAGFGFGYRYTLAGIAQAETAQSPRELVKILDEVSRYQGSLDQIRAWEPTYDNDGVTLAMRALFTVASASTTDSYNDLAEKELPNPLLFDVVAAVRSDLTFLMNVRAWLSVNYADWVGAGENATMKSQPTQRGYLYLSAPRKEFLGRFISDGSGHVGDHPPLPQPLKDAIQSSKFSATVYIRPGLFHFELGWPFELQMQYGDPKGDFHLDCRGGLIHRVEDGAMLLGIAFRAAGFARFSGRVGGSSLGASASAHATFALEAKALAYLSLRSPGDTMLYGSFQLNVTVAVAVEVWLRFKVWRYTVSLRAGFSLSLSLAVAVELVILQGQGIGGRAHVAIGVRAFGRSLSLGIGFAFGSDKLDIARARVARFMELGLGVDTPSGEALGRTEERAPAVEASRGARATVADNRIEGEAEQNTGSPPVDQPELEESPELREEGEDMTPTAFWALIFPTRLATDPGKTYYLLQLIPRDHTSIDGLKVDPKLASFYASPKVIGNPRTTDLRFDKEASKQTTHWVKFDNGAPEGVWSFDDAGQLVAVQGNVHETTMALDVAVTEPQPGFAEGIDLGTLMTEMFLAPKKADADMTEPSAMLNDAELVALDGDADANAARLARAGRSRRNLAGKDKQEAEIRERRSAVIGAIVETAAGLAARRQVAGGGWPATARGKLECRHLGLTFVVSRDALNQLFPQGPGAAPPSGVLQVKKRDADGFGQVHLFNPRERHFMESAPRLAGAQAVRTASGVSLNWDLEPAWGASRGAYDDPEFHLNHYTIVRRITDLKVGEWQASFRVKSACAIESDSEGRQRFIRPPMQFVDDFTVPASLPDDLRRLLRGEPGDAAPLVWDKYCRKARLTIEYLVVPVDVAGTSDVGNLVEITLDRPALVLRSPREAKLEVTLPAIPVLGWKTQNGPPSAAPAPVLALELAMDAPPEPKDTYRLRLRAERLMAGGQFGADAVANARRRPDQDEMDARRETDLDFLLTVGEGVVGADHIAIPWPGLSPQDALRVTVQILTRQGTKETASQGKQKLLEALGITDATAPLAGVRCFLRREPWPAVQGQEPGEWRYMTLGLIVLGIRNATEVNDAPQLVRPGAVSPIDATLEVFEAPRTVEFQALQRRDMNAESGRLHLVKPHHDGDLFALLEPKGKVKATAMTMDVKRRVGTRLAWRARPSYPHLADGTNAPAAAALIGGFDLFSVDADLLPGDFDPALYPDPSRYAKPLGRVTLLPSAMRGLVPAEFGDLAKIETSYPSEHARLQTAHHDFAGTSETSARLGAWYSLAESAVVFPRPALRRSLFAAPDEALIASLFAKGRPVAIRVRLVNWPTGAPSDPLTAPDIVCTSQANGELDRVTDVAWHEMNEDDTTFTRKVLTAPHDGAVQFTAERFTVPTVRRLLQALQLRYPEDKAYDALWHQRWTEDPALFAKLQIRVEALWALDAPDNRVVAEEFAFDPLPAEHPLLADALDFLLFHPQKNDAHPGEIYRRYEVVREAPPQTNAKTFAAWLNEVPPQRDPYGWGALRLLGLATGLRVYDTETGDYLRRADLLRRVAGALARARRRYATALRGDIGSPFVDLVTRPWGNAKLFWFDGGQRNLTREEELELVSDELLATVQLALRPLPDRLRPDWSTLLEPVRYWCVRVDPADGRGVTAIRFETKSTGRPEFYDVVEAGEFAQPHPTRDKDGIVELSLTPVRRQRLFFVRAGSHYAYQRLEDSMTITVTGGTATVTEVSDPPIRAGERTPAHRAFGAFGELSPADWARVLAKGDETQGFTLGDMLGRMSYYATRRFGAAPPLRTQSELEERTRQTITFWKCFLEHSDTQEHAGNRLPFSLGTLADPGNWAQPAADDGTLTTLHVEPERFGSRRRYAVRPVGRFESLSRAVPTALVGKQVYRYTLPHGLERGLPASSSAWNDCFVDATLPRTEPVTKPVILAANRLDDQRVLELVVAHPADQVLAHANRGTQAGLAQHGVSVGFWREFAYKGWAASLIPDADVLAEFGDLDGTIPEDGLELTLAPAQLPGLRSRVPDALMGAWVFRARSLPYFFRIHAVVHASAGIMVSEQTGTTFEEGFPELRLPWAPDHHAPIPPHVPVVSVVKTDGKRSLKFSLPTVRFIDCMDPRDAKLWFAKETQLADVIHLPEPSVGYRIVRELARPDGSPIAWEPEIELLPAPPRTATSTGVYIVQRTGSRLTPLGTAADGSQPQDMRPEREDGTNVWQLHVSAWLQGAAPASSSPPVNDDYLPAGWEACLLPLKLVAADDLSAWRTVAPRGVLTVQLHKPQLVDGKRDWAALAGHATARITELADWDAHQLAPLAAAGDRLAAIREVASSADPDAQWLATFGTADEQVQFSIDGWFAGLPDFFDQVAKGAAVLLPAADIRGDAVARRSVLRILDKLTDACAKDLREAFHAQMRNAYASAQREAIERAASGVPPLSKALTAADAGFAKIVEQQASPFAGLMYAPVQVKLPAAPWDLEALDGVLEHCEHLPGAGPAVQALLDAMSAQAKPAELALTLPIGITPELEAALQKFDATLMAGAAATPAAVVLWAPPTDEELRAVTDVTVRERLTAYAQEQLFGVGYRPTLLVTRARAAPLSWVIARRV
jgi:hypothetical protein